MKHLLPKQQDVVLFRAQTTHQQNITTQHPTNVLAASHRPLALQASGDLFYFGERHSGCGVKYNHTVRVLFWGEQRPDKHNPTLKRQDTHQQMVILAFGADLQTQHKERQIVIHTV